MAVLRKAHKSNFTVIDNQVFKSNLSLKARGLLSTMLSLPDNWHFTEAGLVSILPKDGRDSLRAAIKELETERFLTREQIRDENGKLGDYVWTFCDYPQVENQPQQNIETQVDYVRQVENPVSENPTSVNPTSVNPTLDSPTSVNHTQLNTKQSNTDGKSKKGASTDGYATAPAKAAPEKKGTYGCYGNVKLSDTDLSKLKAEFPADWQERIDRLSTYMDGSGKSYKNHLVTIRNWARRDAKREATSHKPLASNPGRREMTPEEVMEKHVCDYFTAQEMLCDGTY